jgi:acyl-homoserine-lactone acylase
MDPENTDRAARSRRTGRGRGTTRRRSAAIATATVLAMIAGVMASVPASAAPGGKLVGGGRYTAEIDRTEYGIPHVLAHDYGSLGYGYGYAFAQDNLCTMAERVVTLRGEQSRYFGATEDNLASDTYYQGINQSGLVPRLLAQPTPLGPTAQLRQMVAGYVAGYNRYLRATGVAHLPDPTCRGASWVRPITTTDIWNDVLDVDRTDGTASFIGDIAEAAPPTAAHAARASAQDTVPAVPARDGLGSNAWALGREATTGHDGMLLANPHYPWQGTARFYQVQLTIPGVLNVSGASLYGTPVVEIGHTQSLAWSHTVSGALQFTLYQLALVPGDPTSYLVDGHAVPMTRQRVTITVPGPGGTTSTVTRTLYSSRYGPVLASGWTTTTAYALADANAGNLRSMNEWLAMDRAENLAQLRTAQDTYQGIPFTYTLAADSTGATWFADTSAVPHVTDAEAARCIDTAEGKQQYPGTYILDGSTSHCGWGRDADAVVPGIFGPGHYPQLTRTDYVANSNDSPWLTNPHAPVAGYPRIYGDTGTEESLRTRLGLAMLSQRLTGTDGLGPAGFTVPTLQQAMLGNRDNSAELDLGDVVAMCRAHPELPASSGQMADVAAACEVLARWNTRTDPGSRGAVLWRQFFAGLENEPERMWQKVPFDPAQPLTTPRGINGNAPIAQHALADAVRFFRANHIPLDIPLGDTQHYASVPLPGCPDREGCFNVIETPSPVLSTDGSYPGPLVGSSFIMAVELTPNGPVTRTILTYSESANPDSPHHADQTVLFSRKQWVTERFTQAQIHADPTRQTTLLHSNFESKAQNLTAALADGRLRAIQGIARAV